MKFSNLLQGGGFTEAESRSLRVGQSLYLPVGSTPPRGNNPTTPPLVPTPRQDPNFNNPPPNSGSSIPKAVDYIWQEISNNRDSVALDRIVGYQNRAENAFSALIRLSPFLRNSVFSTALLVTYITNKAMAYAEWYNQVAAEKPWDHKRKLIALNKREFGGDGLQSIVTGSDGVRRTYNYQLWSNLHYGYIGRLAKFSSDELLSGAGLAQIKTNFANVGVSGNLVDAAFRVARASNPNAFSWDPSSWGLSNLDDPADQAAVRLGMDLFQKYQGYMVKDQFLTEVTRSNIDRAYS